MGSQVLLLNLPSPPNQRLWRDTAGGFGTSLSCPQGAKLSGEAPLYPFFPYAASVLKQAGIEFKIVDCQRLNLDNGEAVESVKKANPSIVFSIICMPSMSNDLKILGKIKESVQNVTTVGVGTVCRVVPADVLSSGKVNVLLRNGYPYINGMVELVQALQNSRTLKEVGGVSYIEKGKTIHTPEPPELKMNDLPIPDYESIPMDGYATYTDSSGRRYPYALILESKGCPYGCVYCPYPLGFGKELTFRSATKIVDEIEYLNKVRNINVFGFKGQTFSYNKKHAMEICTEIVKRKLDVTWFCESRVDEVNRGLLERMKEAGCRRIHFGVETGDPETLKIAKPGVKLETIKKAFSLAKDYGFVTQAHIVLGWPADTLKTLENTRRFLLSLDPDVLNLNFFTPYPGTILYEQARKDALLLTTDWSNYTSHKVVMRTKSLNEAQLYAIKKRIVRDFSILKLKQHLQLFDTQAIGRPRLFINKAKTLVNRVLFPTLN